MDEPEFAGEPEQASIGVAWFAGPTPWVKVVEPGIRLRSASILKPLLCWAAAGMRPFADDPGRWRTLAAPAVSLSANDPTDEIWEAVGPAELLGRLEDLTGVSWPLPPVEPNANLWGRVRVSAGQLASAYAVLMGARDDAAGVVRSLMWGVPSVMSFGARAALARALDVPEYEIMVKTGWFGAPEELGIRTHAVAAYGGPDGFQGVAVTTFTPTTAADRETYAAIYVEGPEVLPVHLAAAGARIVTAIEWAAHLHRE